MEVNVSNVKIEPEDYGEDEIQEVIVDGYAEVDDISQLVVDPNELGILGNVMNSYDEMQDRPDSNGVEFLLGNSGQSYIVSVKRVNNVSKSRPIKLLSQTNESQHNVDLSLVKQEPIDEPMNSQVLVTQGLECVETTFNEIIEQETTDQLDDIDSDISGLDPNDQDPDDLDFVPSCEEVSGDEIVLSDSDVEDETISKKSGNKIFKCSQCKYSVKDKDKLFDHISKKHSDKRKKKTTKKNSKDDVDKILKKIKTKINKPKKGATKITELKFKMKNKQLEKFLNMLTEEENDTVIIKSAKTDEEQKCNFCEFKSNDINEYFRHVGSEHAHDPIYTKDEEGKLRTDCVYCEFKASNRKLLLAHVRRVHPQGELRFKCDHCEYATTIKHNLIRHVQVVHEKKRDVACPECDYMTTRSYLLQKHILLRHRGIMPYKCTEPGCNFGHHSSSMCKAHIMEVHKNIKPYKCTESDCDFASSARFLLKRHLLKQHKIDNPSLFPQRGFRGMNPGAKNNQQTCPYCQYTTLVKFNLQKHINVVHFGLKPFKCDVCPYTCASKAQLNMHVLSVHKGEYAYTCDVCDFRCMTKQRFIHHYGAKHLKERPYKCHLCDYKGGQPIHLKRHIEVVHKGEKPHFCVYCQFNTAHRGNLKAHLKAIHKVEEKDVWQVMKTCIDLRKEKRNNRLEPAQSTNQSPAQSTNKSPAQSTNQSPAQSTYQSPAQSTYQSPAQSTYQSPAQSTNQSPAQSPHINKQLTSKSGASQTVQYVNRTQKIIKVVKKVVPEPECVEMEGIVIENEDEIDNFETLQASLVLEQIGNQQYSSNSSYPGFSQSVISSPPNKSANLTKSFIVQL